jgi:putative endonuclease
MDGRDKPGHDESFTLARARCVLRISMMFMPFVYILGTSTPRGPISYVGWTLDLERRLAQHNAGTGARTTRGRVWSLLHSESFETREDAMSREWYLKRDRKFRKHVLAALTPPRRRGRRARSGVSAHR